MNAECFYETTAPICIGCWFHMYVAHLVGRGCVTVFTLGERYQSQIGTGRVFYATRVPIERIPTCFLRPRGGILPLARTRGADARATDGRRTGGEAHSRTPSSEDQRRVRELDHRWSPPGWGMGSHSSKAASPQTMEFVKNEIASNNVRNCSNCVTVSKCPSS